MLEGGFGWKWKWEAVGQLYAEIAKDGICLRNSLEEGGSITLLDIDGRLAVRERCVIGVPIRQVSRYLTVRASLWLLCRLYCYTFWDTYYYPIF